MCECHIEIKGYLLTLSTKRNLLKAKLGIQYGQPVAGFLSVAVRLSCPYTRAAVRVSQVLGLDLGLGLPTLSPILKLKLTLTDTI